MTLHGVDVSSHQPTWKPGSGDQFVFIKASEGTSYRNPDRTNQASRARKAGLVVGWYHFLHHGNIQAQADYFVATSGIQAGDLLVCDWEVAGCTTADKDQFIRAVMKARPSAVVGLYCNTNWWRTVDTTNYCGDFLWIAAYQSNKPDLDTAIRFWQYTDTPLDKNHGYFDTVADLELFATGRKAPDPGTTTVPVHPTLDAIRTPYGKKGSSWASGYHQGDDWHRNAGQAEIGDPIYAVASGKIIYAGDARKDGGNGWGSAFGIHVLNQWDEHGRTSIDAHMSKLHVKAGDRVSVGDLIGEKGATGNVSGPHDHHEQHTGTRWADPHVKPIYPGKSGPAPTPAPAPNIGSEDFDVSDQGPTQKRTTAQVIKPDQDYQELKLEDNGDLSFGFGGGRYEINARLVITGLSASEELMLRVIRFDTDDSKRIKGSETEYWVQGLPGGGGKSYRQFEWKWHVPEPPKGKGRRLRLAAAQFTDHDVTVESIHTVTWKAPL